MAPVKVISISAAVLALVAIAARRRLMVVTAYGSSMEPTFPTGTRLLVVRTRRVRTGDIVVLQHQDGERPGDAFASDFLVKRLAATPGDQVPASVAAVVDADDGGLVLPAWRWSSATPRTAPTPARGDTSRSATSSGGRSGSFPVVRPSSRSPPPDG